MATADLESFTRADPSSNSQYLDPFDPIGFPDDFPSDFNLNPFDGDVEFSLEDLDLLHYPDIDVDFPSYHSGSVLDGGECTDPISSAGVSGCKEGLGFGVSPTSSPLPGNSSNGLRDSENFYAAVSPDSGMVRVDVECTDVKLEERKGIGLKRKNERTDGEGTSEANPDVSVRHRKFRKSEHFDDMSSLCLSDGEKEEGQKRKARLIRNRESAHLSRQRKKQYVEELEEKLRSMHSIITDLNGKISFFMVENASLRKQLGSAKGIIPPPSAVYPPINLITPMHYPWIPCSGYALRPPGSQVPLIPIPKLKPQQPASAAKSNKSQQPSSAIRSKKSDGKKIESKTKKVASVSLLGVLLFMFFVGFLFSGVDFGRGGYVNLFCNEYEDGIIRISGQSNGRVLPVTGDTSNLNQTEKAGLCGVDKVCQRNNLDRFHVNGRGRVPDHKMMQTEVASKPSEDYSCRPLLASLYVPRNDKLFKIDGNLIISSVLASEKAMTQTQSEFNHHKITQTSGTESKETSLAIAQSLASAFAVSKSGRDARRQSHSYRRSNEYQLPPSSFEKYNYNIKPNSAHGPLKEWFRERLEGPIFSSAMCTEVFQFDVSASCGSSSGTMSADSLPNGAIYNGTEVTHNSSQTVNLRNRRILYSHPIPPNGSTLDNTREGTKEPPENSSLRSTKRAESIVVSILVDPREFGDDDVMRQPKSVSRIFVVVLVDSVKYITYSCVLPLISSASHLTR